MGEISKINMGGVDYNIRDKVLEEQLGNINAKPMISVTYAELVTLRDIGELVAGMQYRITDFVTTTAQENTRSAGHQFDVIVTADNKNTLNEVARTCHSEFDIEKYKDAYSESLGETMLYVGQHEYEGKEYHLYESESHDTQTLVDFNVVKLAGFDTNGEYPYVIYPLFTRLNNEGQWSEWYDGRGEGETISFKHNPTIVIYFNGANLAAWQIWYSLDNDTQRFAWADTENGKGVIYRMIDEWNNDLPYDFKNIQFKRYILNADDAFATDVANGGELEIVKAKLREMSHKIHTNFWYYGEYISDVYPEANPDARYVPFGDMDYNNEGPQVLCKIGDNNFGWFYTFHNENEDASLLRPNTEEGAGVYDNIIKDNYFVFNVEEGTGSYYPTKINAQSLNNIVFVGNYCYSNSFGNSCNSNSFGNSCYSNSFGNYCYSNSFGNSCNSNSFGNYCYSNSFGNSCNSNSFGNSCNSNSFGNYCYSNSFGNSSQSNELKTYYRYITFGEGVQFVTLQNEIKGDYDNQVQNYRVANGTHGEDGNPLVVDVIRSMGCETFIGMDSNDELKVFCLADLLNNL